MSDMKPVRSERGNYTGATKPCRGYPNRGDCRERVPENTESRFCNGCWMRELKAKAKTKKTEGTI
jgi:hypothetical protein